MNIELVTIPRRELEAMIQDAVREAVQEAVRDIRDPAPATDPDFMSRAELAELMGIDPGSLRNHHAKGLTPIKRGRRTVYRREDVRKYLSE